MAALISFEFDPSQAEDLESQAVLLFRLTELVALHYKWNLGDLLTFYMTGVETLCKQYEVSVLEVSEILKKRAES